MRGLLILAAVISLSLAQVNKPLDCSLVRCAAPPAGCQRDGKTCCGFVCPATTCQTNSQCEEGSFCKKSSCGQTATGSCTKIPQICPLNFMPVCGCDGKTYGNGCKADAGAMTVQSTGECPTAPGEPDCSAVKCMPIPDGCERKAGTCCEAVCPGECQTDSQCGEGSFCKKDSCSQTATGNCTKISRGCTREFRPVCGCNGKTYSNKCTAGTDAMNIRSEGSCSAGPSGPDCSAVRCMPIPAGCQRKAGTCCGAVCPGKCQTDSQCEEGSFCKKTSCSKTATGACAKIPQGCPKNISPVCGCNGKTYGNRCGADADKMTVLAQGECPTFVGPDCSTVKCVAIPDGCQRKAGTCCEVVCPETLPSLATFDTSMGQSDAEGSLNRADTPSYAIALLVIGCLLLISLVTLIVLAVAVSRKHTTERT